MGVFRFRDRWQQSIRDIWNREDQTDRLMALLEQRDRDLEDWLQTKVIYETCTSTTRPTGVAGKVIFETDTLRTRLYDGTGWLVLDEPWQTWSPTLYQAATVTYTLTALTDALGRSATFAGGVRGLWIRVTSRTAGDYLTVGAAGTNPWTSMFGGTTPTIKVFKFLCVAADLTDEYAVTASSNEQLKITNSGSNSITFEIGLIGCSS